MNRPFALWPLIFLLIFLSIGGFYGGAAMLMDPSGNLLGIPGVLPLSPVSNYTFPGLFLFMVMGLAPLFLSYGLLARPHWTWTQPIYRRVGYHWSWTGTLVLVFVLASWLTVQGFLIGFKWGIQYITAATGVLIFLLVMTPSVKSFYAK